jgi:hypothetical protein
MEKCCCKGKGERPDLLNRQLGRLGYETLGDLAKDILLGQITDFTEEKQIEAMKINLQSSGIGVEVYPQYMDLILLCISQKHL